MASEKISNRIASLDISENQEMKEETRFISLKSKDGKIFRVTRENASISDLVFAAIEGEPDAEEVPLPSVNADVLTHIVEYMNKKKGDKTVVVVKPLKVTMEDSCPGGKWEAEFINKVADDKILLRAIVTASNYMAINSLLHLSCARVGLSLKGKSKAKMMEELGITKA